MYYFIIEYVSNISHRYTKHRGYNALTAAEVAVPLGGRDLSYQAESSTLPEVTGLTAAEALTPHVHASIPPIAPAEVIGADGSTQRTVHHTV